MKSIFKRPHWSVFPLLLTILFGVAGCASRPPFAPVASVPADRSLVYFYGPQTNLTVATRIYYQDRRLVNLGLGQYFAHYAVPGTNVYSVPDPFQGLLVEMMVNSEPSRTQVRLEPGETYFFKVVGAGTLLRVENYVGEGEIVGCRLAKPSKALPEEVPPQPKK